MPDHATLKLLHVGLAALSGTLFLLRGAWRTTAPARVAPVWVRVAPHVIDTLLLAAGVALAWQLSAAATRGWLGAKLAALVVYIVLGSIALERGRHARSRAIAFAGACLAFAYIVGVAVTRSPAGPLSLLASP
jgi:uncharacterized membrane protein SirB2